MPPSVCGEAALTEFARADDDRPRERRRRPAVLPTASCSPAAPTGTSARPSAGRAGRVSVSVRPPESVAVRRSSRCDGYSWSGAVNEPPATPAKVWIGCVWQFDGQWCRIERPGERRGGQGPVLRRRSPSPRTRSTSPTFQRQSPATGVSIVAVGGVLPTVMDRSADAGSAPAAVGHPQPRRVYVPALRVGEGRLRGGRVVVRRRRRRGPRRR